MKVLLGLAFSGLLWMTPAWGKHGNEDEHSNSQGRVDREDHGSRKRGAYFEERDVRVIREYYAPRHRALPPGLAKKYYRTGHLPAGWQTRIEPVPVVVERELPPVQVGYRRGVIDGFAVIYNPSDGLIVDVTAVFGN
jgi:hypothetical protein